MKHLLVLRIAVLRAIIKLVTDTIDNNNEKAREIRLFLITETTERMQREGKKTNHSDFFDN